MCVLRIQFQGLIDQFQRLAAQALAAGHGQCFGIAGKLLRIFSHCLFRLAKGRHGFIVTTQHLVGAGKHQPAIGVVRIFLHAGGQLFDHGIDILCRHLRLRHRLFRIQGKRIAEQGVTGNGQQGQGKQQRDSRWPATLRRTDKRLILWADLFQHAPLQFRPGLLEIIGRQTALGMLALQFGQLVAIDGQVGTFAVGVDGAAPLTEPQGGKKQRQRGQEEKEGKNGKWGHFESSSFSKASARRASSALRGLSVFATRMLRRFR